MIEVVVDRNEEHLQAGATFIFESINEDFLKFLDFCLKQKEFIEIREVD